MKRGGRESDDYPKPAGKTPLEFAGGPAAAANPAARCMVCSSRGRIRFHAKLLHERVRALEAELAEFRFRAEGVEFNIARAEKAEAEVERLRMIFRSHQIKYKED